MRIAVLALLLAASAAVAAEKSAAPRAPEKAAKAAKAAKSATPKGAETVTGEVASTDALRGEISVRTAPKTNRDFVVGEATKILREQDGKKTEIGLEAVSVGDAVEVHLRDGKAVEIHARPAAR